MALSTELTRALGIEHPIISAGMGGEAGPALAAAVSNAGALGSMGSIGLPPAKVREAFAACRDLTSRPWGVNIITFDWAPFASEIVTAAIEERVPVITLSFGDPVPALRRCQDAGIPTIVQVQDFPTAKAVLAARPTAIVVQGSEAGGHTGQRSTLSFAAQVLDAAEGVPVIVAGGVGNGRGLAAALAMGAAGVVMGTRFKASNEAQGSDTLKARIAASDGENTLQGEVFDAPYPINWPAGIVGRALRSSFSEEWAGREPELRQRAAALPPFGLVMELNSNPDTEINWAGESAGLVHDVLPAAEIVRRTVAEAEALIGRLTAVHA